MIETLNLQDKTGVLVWCLYKKNNKTTKYILSKSMQRPHMNGFGLICPHQSAITLRSYTRFKKSYFLLSFIWCKNYIKLENLKKIQAVVGNEKIYSIIT